MIFAFALISLVCPVFATPQVDIARKLSLRQVKPVLKTAARQFVSEYNSSGCSDFTSVGCNPIQCFETKCAEDAAANFCDYPRPFYNIVFKGFWADSNPLKSISYATYLINLDSFQDDFLKTMWPIQIALRDVYGMSFRQIQDGMFSIFRQHRREEQTEENKLAAYQAFLAQQSSRQLDDIDDSEDSDVAGRRLSWKQTVREARDQFISDYVTNSCTDFTSSGCDPIVFFDTNCGAGDYCQHTRPFYNKVFKGIWDQGTAPNVTKLESYVSRMDGQDSFLSTMWPIQITLNRDYGMTFREIQDAMLARFRQGPRTEANKLAAYQFVLDDEIETTEQQSEDGAVSEPSDDAILFKTLLI